jgi:transketolase
MKKINLVKKLEDDSKKIRKIIIEAAYNCGESAHIGGALSMTEIINYLYSEFLKHDPKKPEWNERDIFILSKGHTCLGFFSALFYYGYFDKEKLNTFQTNGTDLIAHPIKKISLGIESSNGSLGQGLSFGMGMAIGFKKREQKRKVVVVLGDGECNEGSVWETAASASELEVDNLIAIVDENGFRNDGPNYTYQKNSSLTDVWAAFGWNVVKVNDGNCYMDIIDAFSQASKPSSKPVVLICKTVKGKGISFMEGNNEWHHNRITESIYNKIMDEIN